MSSLRIWFCTAKIGISPLYCQIKDRGRGAADRLLLNEARLSCRTPARTLLSEEHRCTRITDAERAHVALWIHLQRLFVLRGFLILMMKQSWAGGFQMAWPVAYGCCPESFQPILTPLQEKSLGCPPTSQGGRDEDVGAVLFDDGIDELLRGGSPAQEADAPLELRHQGQWVVEQVPPLNGCVPHLPTGKLPTWQDMNTRGVRCWVWRGKESPWGPGRRMVKEMMIPLDNPAWIHTWGYRARQKGRGGEEKWDITEGQQHTSGTLRRWPWNLQRCLAESYISLQRKQAGPYTPHTLGYDTSP